MPDRTQEYLQLAEKTARSLTRSHENWTGFLIVASRLYKYDYQDQLMIYAQRPEATACASYELWNNTMHRYVRRGSKGIALLSMSGGQMDVRYVFDVADTGRRASSRDPYLWQMEPRHEQAVADALNNRFGIAADHGLVHQIENIAQEAAADYWQEHKRDVLGIVDGSFLEEYDEFDVGASFRKAARTSIAYMLMARCGLEPEKHFEHEDFMSIFDWNTPDAVGMLGTAVSEISQQVLRHIEMTIKGVERSVEYEHHPLQAGGRLSDSRSEAAAAESPAAEQVRQDAGELPEGEPQGPVERDAPERDAAGAPSGDRQDGEPAAGADDERADGAGGDHGSAEGARSDGVDAADEQPEGTGRGSNSQRTDLQLNFLDSVFLSEASQIEQIGMAESADRAPFASFFSQEEIDHLLRVGSNEGKPRMKIAAAFMKEQSIDVHAEFLKEVFRNGHGIKVDGKMIAAWCDEDGIRMAKGSTARYSRIMQKVSWHDAAVRIHELLEAGQFATNVELAEARSDEIRRIADSLWYMRRDFSQEANDAGYVASLSNIRGKGGFPAEVERVSVLIADSEARAQIITELQTFIEAYQENKELLRFRFHKPSRILDQLEALNLPVRTFQTEMAEIPWVSEFITDDEIDLDLSRGTAEGKSRRIDYLSKENSLKDKADALKHAYGIGGHSHALGGCDSGWEEHDGKGIRYRKGGCPEVRLTWPNVVKRLEELIRKDRYLTQKDKEELAALQEARQEPEADAAAEVIEESSAPAVEAVEMPEIPTGAEAVVPEIEKRYFVYVYHHFENGFDDKMDYHTLEEAEKAAQGYVDGTMEPDGFKYDGAAIYDLKDRKYLRIFGDYPDANAQRQVDALLQGEQAEQVHDNQIEFESSTGPAGAGGLEPETGSEGAYTYRIGDQVYLDQMPFEVTEIRDYFIQLRDLNSHYPIFRAVSRDELLYLMAQDERNDPLRVVDAEPEIAADAVSMDETEKSTEYPQGFQQTFPQTVENFRITDDHLGEGGAKTKFRKNMDAIHLLKKLESENRQATPDEQEILSQYVGWGGLPDAFDESKAGWAQEYHELATVLTKEEYEAARASTLNAHYTSPTVICAIYEAVEKMGFKSGNVLEPAMGVGNFFGMMPESMRDSRLYGVELDSITGRIAKQLYPKANITVAGFETTNRKDFFDLAIGNVPFGNYKVDDRAYNKLGFSIHDYFFAKTLDQVRPGGVIAFVTSRYTMDKQSPEVRKYIAQRAELLGAIRLPNNAFKANAGTDVVSDILFLQKRETPITIEPEWVHLDHNRDGFAINSYFVEHPEMVLGVQSSESTQYGKQDFTVLPREDQSLDDQLHEAVSHIGGTYQEAELPDLNEGETIKDTLPADPDVKNYSYTVVDGEVYYRENSVMVRPDLNQTARERIKGMVQLRECVHQLIDAQMNDHSETDIQCRQTELNALYDAFTAKHGLINDRANRLAFADDSSYYLLCSLEVLDDEGKLKRKADMFTKRTIRQQVSVDHVDTAAEALAVSIGERAKVDLSFMEELTGKTREQIVSDLTGVIFRLPASADESPQYVTADEYLSGNVRQKLREAQRMADLDPAFQPNVAALTAAQPKDLDASEIDVRLGATWVDKDYIQEFMYELLRTNRQLRYAIKVNYSPYTAEWNISHKTWPSSTDVPAYVTYGTDRANAYEILEDTLNLRDVRVYDTVRDQDGNEKRVLNQRATTLAQQKQQAIKEAFRDWVWKDPDRRQTLVARYNELFNSTRPREFDGSHLVFSGMNPEISLREHQLNAVAHVLYGGNTLLAHVVGAGKSFEMVAAAMESKRLGLCQKSMFVVPNHLTEQWASEFLRLYPSANILVTTKKDFEKRNRQKFCSRIATGDYDAVIIGHSQFEKIPVSFERQERLLQEQMQEITDGIEELKRNNGERFSIKQLEKTRKQVEARLKKLRADNRKDNVVTFEQLGVDRLFVDEAHSYKNMFLYTKMRNVAGLSTTDAQKSSDMFMKCRYMDEITGGRGIVFATGTPISNSMTEMYTMQRYLQYGTLKRNNLTHFDAWASTFGETTTSIELAPEGTGYRARTRFAKFFNLPELMTLFKEVADIKMADQLNLPTPKANYETVVVKPTELQQEIVQTLSERASKIHRGEVTPTEDNMLKVTSDGRKLGLDQRLINPLFPDDPGSKVNACVNNVFRIWKEGEADRLTQLIFCDLSTPKGTTSAATPLEKAAQEEPGDAEELRGFNVYDDIRSKLVSMGVPGEEVAFIHEANTEVQKKVLFAKVRSGQVRVLIGSTAKMGAGTNCQDRLIAIHDADCPWRPGDLEQRAGRIVRQGNRNKEVFIYRYVTEGTFDSYLYQTVENKQKFISQIMTSKSPVRACEDIDETVLSYAEIKALCAGDDRIREKMDLDVDVARLRLMKADHQSKQYRMEDRVLRYFPQEIEERKAIIAGYERDLQLLSSHPIPADGFAGMTLFGKFTSDKEIAGKVILSACKDVAYDKPMPIGEYRGMSMTLSIDGFAKQVTLTLKGEMSHRVELGTDPKGNLIRIENALSNIPHHIQLTRDNLARLRQEMADAKAEIGKPFPQEQELQEKSARLAELDIALNIDKGHAPSHSDEAVAKRPRPSVLEQLKAPARSGSPNKKKREMEAR